MEPLTVSKINECIDNVLQERCNERWMQTLQQRNIGLQHIKEQSDDWKSLTNFISTGSTDLPAENNGTFANNLDLDLKNRLASPIPFFFAIGLFYQLDRTTDCEFELCGVLSMYMAYSTWDGRCLFIDRFDIPNTDDVELEKAMLQLLAQIAVTLGCARLNWRRQDIPPWYVNDDEIPPEILYGWLTLRMDRDAMVRYVGVVEDDSDIKITGTSTGSIDQDDMLLSYTQVSTSVEQSLAYIHKESSSDKNSHFHVRLSTNDDVDANDIARLVKGLAVYEKEPDAVNVTSTNYRHDGSSNEPLFYCLLFEDVKTCDSNSNSTGKPYSCGMAFVYFGYELGRGRFLYLEDLFLEEPYRKLGGGSLAMKLLARVALALHCQSFCWVALDWNTPALNLYEKIGAKVQNGVLTIRYKNEGLQAIADQRFTETI